MNLRRNGDFMQQTAFISGASRGIGRAIAEKFAKEGYQLILTCLHSYPELETFCQQLQAEYSISCQGFCADMAKEEDVKRVFSSLSHLDVLVNNAGISHIGLLSDMTSEEWHRVLSVNLDSCFYTCREAIPLMLKKHQGKIINISSVWGNVGASCEVSPSTPLPAVLWIQK